MDLDPIVVAYLEDVCRHPRLSPKEEREVSRKARAGDAAATRRMIEGNLRLVLMVAKRYQGSGVPMPDLISEGNLGLLTAVERFDPERGFRFSTYATWWIRRGVQRAVESSSLIRRPRDFDGEIGEVVELPLTSLAASPDDRVEVAEDAARTRRALRRIDPRRREVLCLRFGIGDMKPRTMQRVGDRLGISRERVRQIEGRAKQELAVELAAG